MPESLRVDALCTTPMRAVPPKRVSCAFAPLLELSRRESGAAVGGHLAVDLLDDTVPGCGNGRLGRAGGLRRAVNREGVRRVRGAASKLAAHGRDRRLGFDGRCSLIVRSVLPSSSESIKRKALGLDLDQTSRLIGAARFSA